MYCLNGDQGKRKTRRHRKKIFIEFVYYICYIINTMDKKTPQKLITKVASKKVLKQNEKAIRSYGHYKKTTDLIDRADIVLGRKPAFKTVIGSTLNFKINQYGVASTTAQKI